MHEFRRIAHHARSFDKRKGPDVLDAAKGLTRYRELVRSSFDSDRADQSPDSAWHQTSRRGVIIIFDVQADRRQYE